MKRIGFSLVVFLFIAAVIFLPTTVSAGVVYIGRIDAVDTVTTVFPANGDLNAHGIAVIPTTSGKLVKGNLLVSHFNNSRNLSGTGTTIIQISPGGVTHLFAQINPRSLPEACPGGIGLTGLAVMKTGWVIAGSLPTSDGKIDTAQAGCLIVLNNRGQVVETISGKSINGPWELALAEGTFYDTLFVSNVLNGPVAQSGRMVNQGNVVRLNLSNDEDQMPRVLSTTVVGSGFGEQSDSKDLILGPTGLAIDSTGTLYVADTVSNRIATIPDAELRITSAGKGHTLAQGGALHSPLGLAITSNNHLLVVNAENGNMVEISARGSQIAVKMVDRIGSGDHTLFGLAVTNDGVYILNDGDDALNILH